jgi:hypothetical protein
MVSEISKRRTFAIISHPDAGKTTVTEKLLLYAGAIKTAGSVKARKSNTHATSDWMEMEKERGISITSSIMQFEYDNHYLIISLTLASSNIAFESLKLSFQQSSSLDRRWRKKGGFPSLRPSCNLSMIIM